jgi:uncharacterized protein with PQ loop repeat
MGLMNSIGWIGSIFFAICAIPQAVQCYKQGHAKGLDWTFLLCWFFGEILTVIYVFPKQDWPLLFNYSINLICLFIIIYFKGAS